MSTFRLGRWIANDLGYEQHQVDEGTTVGA
jgi:hypothetical protein